MPFNAHAKVSKEVVAELLAAKQREDRTLDYKQALPGTNDDARNDFLADVTAMANTSGGVILYGIEEQRDTEGKATGQPERVCGLPGVNVEQERQRLVNWLKHNVDPNIPGVDIYEVVGVADGPVIAVQTPRSWSAPHLIQMGRRVAFYRRNSVGNQPMDWHEIRSAFAAGEGERERIERFRNDRLGKIISNSVGWTLDEGARLVLHVVPIGALGAESVVDVQAAEKQPDPMHPMGNVLGVSRFVYEGVLNYVHAARDVCQAYTLLYREGVLESVYIGIVRERDSRRFIPSQSFEEDVLERLPGYMSLLAQNGRTPPYLVMLTLSGVQGAEMGVDTRNWIEQPNVSRIGHDCLVLPPVFINEAAVDVATAMRPVFDAVWNAAGWPASRNYDKDGKWVGQDRR